MVLKSDQLLIRNTLISDSAFYFKLFNDPDWITFIGNKNLKSEIDTKMYLKGIIFKNSKLGELGFFTIILKETNKLIGTSKALQRDRLDFIDIGYALKIMGKGYATEATELIMEYVCKKIKQKRYWH
ncbi:GNAT family N-acetyltransferase [Tenacibaculum tangerinum]|uniref:GNAT family N-acetyltransferase n=1 Tax=Tenacibaculum tangerinum TaxID=3038772 RepID=A0ABY8KY12_9FLAO|nr:GNAT family N-acetyltransferase [Tenacibaculum tangerinum]WGH74141.1 GNAT family N-acetyltransferase [Tenacibaculum tangerinum]